ncbi:MAG: InlB B-repeat-containing protein [Lachnospiraceae bacterium]|nr:InlB B-repeat-containing protein [Lachnospiraceae bacterium]
MKNNAVRKGRENTSLFTIMWRIMAIFFCVMMIGGLSSHCAAAEEATTDVVEMAVSPIAEGMVDLKEINTVRQGGSVFSARRGNKIGNVTVEASPAEGGSVELAQQLLGVMYFKAVPNNGYVLVGWTINNGSQEEYLDAAVNPIPWSNTTSTITAHFKKVYQIYDASYYSEKGALEVITNEAREYFLPGEQITLWALPYSGYRLEKIQYGLDLDGTTTGVEWVDLPVSNDNVATFTMPDSNVWIKGVFYSTSPHTLSLNSLGNGTVTYNGKTTAQVMAGQSVTLTITPNDGYMTKTISGVTEDYNTETHTFIMPDQDMNISVEFVKKKTYELLAEVNDTSLGHIQYGVNGETGVYSFYAIPNNTTIYVDGWYDKNTGALLTEEPVYSFIPHSNMNMEARFTQGNIVVLSNNISHGSLEYTPHRDYTAQYPEKTCYKPDETIKLVGTPDEGYLLEGYYYAYLDISDINHITQGNTTRLEGNTLTMDHSYVILANFVKAYTVSVSSEDSNAGTVSGNGKYAYNDNAWVTATAKEGYEFVEWTDASGKRVSDQATYRFNVTGNTTLIAKFRRVYTLTLTNSILSFDGTDATFTGAGTYHYGDTVTVKAIPADGSAVLRWYNSKNYTLVSEEPEFTFTIYEDTALEVMLWKIVTINVVSGNEAYGTVSGGGTCYYGESFTITAQPKKNCEFVKWVDSSGNTISTSASFSGNSNYYVQDTETFTAIFKLNPGTVNFVSNGQNLNSIIATSITASDFPEDPASANGYEFVGWDKTLTEINTALSLGDTITVNAQWKEVPVFQTTLNMADYTGIGVYVHIPDGEDPAQYTVVTKPNNTGSLTVGEKNIKLTTLAKSTRTIGTREAEFYGRIDAMHLASAEMTDTVVVTLKKNGVTVLEEIFTVAGIVEERCASGELDEVRENLNLALIQYGYYAQLRFGKNLDRLPNVDFDKAPALCAIPAYYAASGDPTDFGAYIYKFEAKLDMAAEVSMNVYLTPATGYSLNNLNVYVTDADGNIYKSYTTPKMNKGRIQLKIQGIGSGAMDKNFKIVVELKNDKNKKATWTRSLITCAYENYQTASEENDVNRMNLLKALFQYFIAAQARFYGIR